MGRAGRGGGFREDGRVVQDAASVLLDADADVVQDDAADGAAMQSATRTAGASAAPLPEAEDESASAKTGWACNIASPSACWNTGAGTIVCAAWGVSWGVSWGADGVVVGSGAVSTCCAAWGAGGGGCGGNDACNEVRLSLRTVTGCFSEPMFLLSQDDKRLLSGLRVQSSSDAEALSSSVESSSGLFKRLWMSFRSID